MLSLCCREGNGNPFQCSCLENPRDRGAWWAAVYGVAQIRTRLKRLGSSSSRSDLAAAAAASSLLRRPFSSCREGGGYSLVMVPGFLTAVASLAAEHRL